MESPAVADPPSAAAGGSLPWSLLVAGAAGKVEAQDAGVVALAGVADAGGLAAIALDPLTDLVVVGRGGGLRCQVGQSF